MTRFCMACGEITDKLGHCGGFTLDMNRNWIPRYDINNRYIGYTYDIFVHRSILIL